MEGMLECINREKQLKNWHREWKLNVIRAYNPEMKDLAAEWFIVEKGELKIADYQTTKSYHERLRNDRKRS